MKAGFVEKLIGRLGKIGPEEMQNYFLQLAQEKGFLETVFNSIQEGITIQAVRKIIRHVHLDDVKAGAAVEQRGPSPGISKRLCKPFALKRWPSGPVSSL